MSICSLIDINLRVLGTMAVFHETGSNIHLYELLYRRMINELLMIVAELKNLTKTFPRGHL